MSKADPFASFAEALNQLIEAWSLPLGPDAVCLLHRHYELMVEANRQFNLTRITDPADAAVLHFADSLAVWEWTRRHRRGIRQVLDVGTGAGFPAVPLAVVCPEWSVTAVDSTGKKARFVQAAAEALGLDNLRVVHARVGEWQPPAPPRRFDLVLARAVGSCSQVVSSAGAMVGHRGWLLVHKTRASADREMKEAMPIAAKMRLREGPRLHYQLTCKGQKRDYVLLSFGKTARG
jgi:16S rRNA (guanine527-N7)-methyltransferase